MMTLKLGEYQRQLMFFGIDSQSQYFKSGNQILTSMFELREELGENDDMVNFEQFVKDPLGVQRKQIKEDELEKVRRFDAFIESIDVKDGKKESGIKNHLDLEYQINEQFIQPRLSKIENPIMLSNIHKSTPSITTQSIRQDDSGR